MNDKPGDPLKQYAGYATQLLAGLGLAVYAGWWLDGKTGFAIPIFIWSFPLILLIGMLWKVVRDTTKK